MGVALRESWAVRARSLLATVETAHLSTRGSTTAVTTSVALAGAGDGFPLLWLEAASPAVPGLAECRVATLCVEAPDATWGLRLLVSLRMRRPDESGRRAYDVTLLSSRVTGIGSCTISVDEFLRTAPDLEHGRREALFGHLVAVHSEDLAAHVRALGCRAEAVVALTVGPAGLEVALLGATGVEKMWLKDPSSLCRSARGCGEASLS